MIKVEWREGNLWSRNIFNNFDEAWIFYYKCLFNNIKANLPKEVSQ